MSPETPEPQSPTPRQRARRTQTDDKIAAAVLAITRREGLHAVSIDAVAAESGVAKTTIYRRYDNRTEMLNGIAQKWNPPPVKDYPATREGLYGILADLQDVLEKKIGLSLIGGLLVGEQTDLEELHARVVTPNIEHLRKYFRAGEAQGAFRTGMDYEQLVEMIIGGLFVGDALRDELPSCWATDLVGLLWPMISAPQTET